VRGEYDEIMNGECGRITNYLGKVDIEISE
jgi:hypothetical protein